MVAPNLCDQCKSHVSSVGSSPCTSSKSTPRSCATDGKNNNKSVYVKAKPSDNACIVFGKGGRKCGGFISLQLPSPSSNLKLICGGGGATSSNCIQIIGNSMIKARDGEFQIIPCKSKCGGGGGGMQISMGGGRPILQLGGGSRRQCGSSRGGSGGGAVMCGGGGGKLQLNFGKGKCGGPPITCGPSRSCNLQITCGPQSRKLDMNHCKPTIAHMIHKRMVELETELRKAQCTYSNLHPCCDNL